MIEKIGTELYMGISKPCNEVIELLRKYLEQHEETINVAEVGVGVGATAVEIVKLLRAHDNYYMFSFEEDVNELKWDLLDLNLGCKNILAFGNSKKIYDSYAWSLAKLYIDSNREQLFDITYLDGAHTYLHDGMTCCLLKEMTKPGGMIVFDDINWCQATSPTMNPVKNPNILREYTAEQISTCQVKYIVDIFMEKDDNWEKVEQFSTNHRATFRKKTNDEINQVQ